MDWVRYIYDKFFMRDLLGKITPGVIELYALSILAGAGVPTHAMKWPWPLYFVVAAAAEVTALAFQTLGEWVGIHSASPRPRRVLFFPAWGRIYEDFRSRLSMITQASTDEWSKEAGMQRERLVYLKEGAGNLGIAMLLLAPTLECLQGWGISLMLLFSGLLIGTHFVHGRRQAEHELRALWRKAKDRDRADLEEMARRLGITLVARPEEGRA